MYIDTIDVTTYQEQNITLLKRFELLETSKNTFNIQEDGFIKENLFLDQGPCGQHLQQPQLDNSCQ